MKKMEEEKKSVSDQRHSSPTQVQALLTNAYMSRKRRM